MVRNDGFDIWHAAVAQFYCVTVENFVEGISFWEVLVNQ